MQFFFSLTVFYSTLQCRVPRPRRVCKLPIAVDHSTISYCSAFDERLSSYAHYPGWQPLSPSETRVNHSRFGIWRFDNASARFCAVRNAVAGAVHDTYFHHKGSSSRPIPREQHSNSHAITNDIGTPLLEDCNERVSCGLVSDFLVITCLIRHRHSPDYYVPSTGTELARPAHHGTQISN
ncbi:hypothetical protein F5Y18DRAFT_368163 [Xylariaceae sp. FL1019]|nr:hypothetical protein F5Y18DRAFT_368163 [Xylariaceae sp. FL1019]